MKTHSAGNSTFLQFFYYLAGIRWTVALDLFLVLFSFYTVFSIVLLFYDDGLQDGRKQLGRIRGWGWGTSIVYSPMSPNILKNVRGNIMNSCSIFSQSFAFAMILIYLVFLDGPRIDADLLAVEIPFPWLNCTLVGRSRLNLPCLKFRPGYHNPDMTNLSHRPDGTDEFPYNCRYIHVSLSVCCGMCLHNGPYVHSAHSSSVPP